MDIKEAAALLNGNEYREEGTPALFAEMKSHRLVAVFGASDDLMEFRGAINDEAGTDTAYIDRNGLMMSKCEEGAACPYFQDVIANAATVEPIFSPVDTPFTFTYETKIPHETFVIMEDDEPYCQGIVFSLDALS